MFFLLNIILMFIFLTEKKRNKKSAVCHIFRTRHF